MCGLLAREEEEVSIAVEAVVGCSLLCVVAGAGAHSTGCWASSPGAASLPSASCVGEVLESGLLRADDLQVLAAVQHPCHPAAVRGRGCLVPVSWFRWSPGRG
jgi:hypothetical protein